MTRLLMTTWLMASACGDEGLETTTITLGDTSLVVEIANTRESRAKGLMKRDSMPEDRGMIFVYPEADVRGFWMKDTRIPLSIAYVDAKGVIKRIADMKPYVTDRVSSLYPAQYAVEVNKGWFQRHGVEVGDVVTGIDALEAK